MGGANGMPHYLLAVAGLPGCVTLVLAEYGVRRLVLRDHEPMPLGAFLRFLRTIDLDLLLGRERVRSASDG